MTTAHQANETATTPRSTSDVRRFFDLSSDLLYIAGVDGVVRTINPAFEHTLGFTRKELLSKPFVELVHPDDREACLEAFGSPADGAPRPVFEIRNRCRDGSYRTISWTITPAADERYAVGRDISCSKRAEREFQQAKEGAVAASRAKSQFLASMSHELRTPLNSVIGFTNLLLKNKDGHLSDREMDFLRRIQSNGTHLLTLVNDVLDLSKVEAGKLEVVVEPIALAAVIADVMAQIEGADQVQGVTLTTLIPEDAVPVMADGHRLKQVLPNLVANAVKFTSHDVTVHVLTDGRRPTRIEVINTGISVPEDRLDAIFEPFNQGDGTTWRRYGGTGLGLAICRSLCEAMGFSLTATSKPGEGSTFIIDMTGDRLSTTRLDSGSATFAYVSRDPFAANPDVEPALLARGAR